MKKCVRSYHNAYRLGALPILVRQCPQSGKRLVGLEFVSEMDERSKREPQIAVRAAIKIHFIRDIETQAEGT